MECPRCHSENREDSRFCSQCGTPTLSHPDICVIHEDLRLQALLRRVGLPLDDKK